MIRGAQTHTADSTAGAAESGAKRPALRARRRATITATVGLLSLVGAGCGAKTGLEQQRAFVVDPTPISLLVVGNHDNGADALPVAPYRNGRLAQDALLSVLLPPLDPFVHLGASVDRDNVTFAVESCAVAVEPLVLPALNQADRVIRALRDAPIGNGASVLHLTIREVYFELSRPARADHRRAALLFMGVESDVCIRQRQETLADILLREQLRDGRRPVLLLPIYISHVVSSGGGWPTANRLVDVQSIARPDPVLLPAGQTRRFYEVTEVEGIQQWISNVLLKPTWCVRRLPAALRPDDVIAVRTSERTYGAADASPQWRVSSDGTAIELIGPLCDEQARHPTPIELIAE